MQRLYEGLFNVEHLSRRAQNCRVMDIHNGSDCVTLQCLRYHSCRGLKTAELDRLRTPCIAGLLPTTARETLDMTILVPYVARPEGWAALEKGIEVAKDRRESLLIVSAGPGGTQEEPSVVHGYEFERVQEQLATCGVEAELRQYVRSSSAVDEINDLVEARDISMLVIGLRRRSTVGKLIMGSFAQDLLMTVACPVLCVKA